MPSPTHRIRLWDLPTRLFHWLLAFLIVAAIVTGKIGGNAMVWHGRIGLAILGLVAFRVAWGLVGSTYARFASFLPTPSSIAAYVRGQWRGLGHNPLGALSVLGLLAMIALQVGTGLFTNDDIAFRGPLFSLVDKSFSDALTSLHRLSINGLIVLIVLHLCAIAFYAHVKKDNLVKPMITGWKDVEPGQVSRALDGGGAIAVLFSLGVAVAAVYAASGAWLPDAKPEVPTATQQAPAW